MIVRHTFTPHNNTRLSHLCGPMDAHLRSIEAGLQRNPGIVATALHCVNAVPYVCAAEPGVRTYLDLPPVAGRAAAHLRR